MARNAIDTVLDFATKQLGQPYVWGGESRSEGGFDCSGLIYTGYALAGINTGRTTWDMAKRGQEVKNLSDLQAGDVLITNGGKHAVMYAGNGQVIAASSSNGRVLYQPLSIFQNSIVTVRRFASGAAQTTKEKFQENPWYKYGPGNVIDTVLPGGEPFANALAGATDAVAGPVQAIGSVLDVLKTIGSVVAWLVMHPKRVGEILLGTLIASIGLVMLFRIASKSESVVSVAGATKTVAGAPGAALAKNGV